MLLLLLMVTASALAAPSTYDQRQEGDFNVRADVQNVVLLVAVPQKSPFSVNLLDVLLKDSKSHPEPEQEIQNRASNHVMEAFVEPPTPYHVEIGEERSVDGGSPVEVIIAGRRSGSAHDLQANDDIKLIGATEQCGPGRERNAVTLMCQMSREQENRVEEVPPPTDDVISPPADK